MTTELSIGLGLYTGQRQSVSELPRYADAIELAVAAEQAGFDSFWVSEHHGFPDGYVPSPLTVLAAAAARTSRIELGTGVVVTPLWNPVRLAEDAAVTDHLSGGRLILGLGLGYAEHEYRAFRVDTATRGAALSDLAKFLRTAWTGESFDWDGPSYRAEGVRVTPTPLRTGGIPIWLGGYADAAVRRAARLGDGYLLGRADPPIVQQVDAQLRAVRDPAEPSFTFALNVILMLTEDSVDNTSTRQGLAYQQAAYEAIQTGGIAHAGMVSTAVEEISAENVTSYVHVYGSCEQAVEQLQGILARLADWARVHLVIRALYPERDVKIQLARVARLGRDVLPALRSG